MVIRSKNLGTFPTGGASPAMPRVFVTADLTVIFERNIETPQKCLYYIHISIKIWFVNDI